MREINIHEVEYMNNILIIKILEKKEVNRNMVSILNISIKKDNDICDLGEFYIPYKESFSKEDINLISKKIIEDADDIIFENNRYIGEDTFQMSTTMIDENLNEIYLEFSEMDKNSSEYIKYSRFLDLYFNSHKIPDSIRKIFLVKNSSSILDYNDLDSKIRSEFSTSMVELISEDEQNKSLRSLEAVNESIIDIENELTILKEIIDKIESILKIKDENHRTITTISDLENKLSNLGLFDKTRRELKNSIKNLRDSIVEINIAEERKKIKESFEKYASLYNDSMGLNILFDNLTLGDTLCILKDIYNRKSEVCDKLINKKDALMQITSNYVDNSIDISDLYDRLEKSRIKE